MTLSASTKGQFVFRWPRGAPVRMLDVLGGSYLSGRLEKDGFIQPIVIAGANSVPNPYDVPEEHSEGPWVISHGWNRQNVYEPFGIPGLHRLFAKASSEPKNILSFARRYGLLGHFTAVCDSNDRILCHGESLSYWQEQIAEMARLIDIWDMYKRGDAGGLSNAVKWRTIKMPGGDIRNSVEFRDSFHITPRRIKHVARELGFEKSLSRPIPKSWRPGDIIDPAYHYVCMRITEKLKGHVDPIIDPSRRADLFMFPDCLISAMYVQFSYEVSRRERPMVVCRGCRVYFPPVSGKQKYCEDRCRKRRWWNEDQRERKSGKTSRK